MSQRDSGYQRKDRDEYTTPTWVTAALAPHLPPKLSRVWEPAAGAGKMAEALSSLGFEVRASDICGGVDFLTSPHCDCEAIVTNPPYGLAQQFIEHALDLTKPGRGVVAMLLRTDYDHAKTRAHLFGGCAAFCKKLVLTRRIVWFDGPNKRGSPSYNHAWFLWHWCHEGPPTIAYHQSEGKTPPRPRESASPIAPAGAGSWDS
jgi:hypothetical protein